MPPGLGLQNILYPSVSGAAPASYAETPTGSLLIANGVDPVLKWDALSSSGAPAGVAAPATAVTVGALDAGPIAGQYVVFVRFIDDEGNPSNLSPASDAVDTGRDGWVEAMALVGSVVEVRSRSHGLADGDVVTIAAVEGTGFPAANAVWAVTRVSDDVFSIPLAVPAASAYWQGGVWTLGVATLTYDGVPVPAATNVARRQILRNLSGDCDVLYVDVDTTDLTSTSFSSTRADDDLATQEAVPLNYGDDDLPWANRNGVPPDWKAHVAVHQGRGFLAGDVTYSAGHAEARFNSTRVVGVGTDWQPNWAGRLIYVDGATKPYEIAAVDGPSQTITLTAPYIEDAAVFAAYAIRPAPGERRLLYYSEPGNLNAWPAYNAQALPEDSDEVTGLLVKAQFLYVLEKRHVYRVTFQEDPLKDGFVFLVTHRGCVNGRCHVTVEGVTYMLDEAGIHAFDGDGTAPVSDPIQNVFQIDGTVPLQVDWTADQTLWHAAADPVRNTIRWFVTMVDEGDLVHAICYNYRQKRYWIEQYPTPMTASCVATMGYRRSLAGTAARRVVCLAEGSYDGVDGTGTTRGTPTAAGAATMTDDLAAFAALEGAPLTVVDGLGRGQTRVIASNTATVLTLIHPWDTVPDATSVYQVGGVDWVWRSGWFRTATDEAENAQDVELVYEPVGVPTTVDLRIFYDHEALPRVWDYTGDDDGRRVVSGSPYITFALDTQKGYVIQRISGHSDQYALGDYFVSIELSGTQAGEPVRIYEAVLSGVGVG